MINYVEKVKYYILNDDMNIINSLLFYKHKVFRNILKLKRKDDCNELNPKSWTVYK